MMSNMILHQFVFSDIFFRILYDQLLTMFYSLRSIKNSNINSIKNINHTKNNNKRIFLNMKLHLYELKLLDIFKYFVLNDGIS